MRGWAESPIGDLFLGRFKFWRIDEAMLDLSATFQTVSIRRSGRTDLQQICGIVHGQ
jgi:hypothetical protein